MPKNIPLKPQLNVLTYSHRPRDWQSLVKHLLYLFFFFFGKKSQIPFIKKAWHFRGGECYPDCFTTTPQVVGKCLQTNCNLQGGQCWCSVPLFDTFKLTKANNQSGNTHFFVLRCWVCGSVQMFTRLPVFCDHVDPSAGTTHYNTPTSHASQAVDFNGSDNSAEGQDI